MAGNINNTISPSGSLPYVIPILYHGNHSRALLFRNVPVDNYMLKHVGDRKWENIEWWKKPSEAEPKP